MNDKEQMEENKQAVRLALGRIFLLLSRPTQPGDEAVYWACRDIILDCAPAQEEPWRPNWIRDRNKGAPGG